MGEICSRPRPRRRVGASRVAVSHPHFDPSATATSAADRHGRQRVLDSFAGWGGGGTKTVPMLDRREIWQRVRDSNPCYRRERPAS